MRRRTLAPALAAVTALLLAPPAEAATIAAVFPNGDPTELTVRIDVDTGAAVTVTWTGTVYEVHDPAGVTPAGDCAAVAGDSTRATCPREPAPDGSFTVAILGGGGDDVLEAGYRSTAFPTGDSIQVFGDAGEDKIGGSPGADFTLSGDEGDDLLDGGGGDALSVDGRGGAAHVYGGPGSDHVGDTESSGEYGDDFIDGGVCPLNTGSFCAGGTAAPGDRD